MQQLNRRPLRSILVVLFLSFLLVHMPTAAQAETIYTLGDEGSAITSMQEDLATLGYDQSFDFTQGKYDKSMREAVARFQQHVNLEKTGKADATTRERLHARAKAVRKARKTEGIPSLFDDNYQLLERGSEGSRVKTLQSALSDLGYDIGRVDGKYGSSTAKAVEAFQRSEKDLYIDGKAGSYTLIAIERCMHKLNGSPASDPSDNDAPPTLRSTLRYKDQGEDVRYLQQRLSLLGYFDGDINGKYRSSTKQAVKDFQRLNDLHQDGICGPETQALLFSQDAVPAK